MKAAEANAGQTGEHLPIEPWRSERGRTMKSDYESQRYLQVGVSAAKDDVHRAVSALPKGLYEGAFCKVTEDIFGNDPNYCVISHADGAGTKSILAYLHYQMHHDPRIFRGIAQDAIVMNLDDLLCVGATRGFSVSTIINRNLKRIDGEIVRSIIEGTQEFAELLNRYGLSMVITGGETADVGDIVKTILVDSVLTTRMPRTNIVKNEIEPGSVIISLASGGPASTYEDRWNSGIGSNGITSARHELFGPSVKTRFGEAYDDTLDPGIAYHGPYDLEDALLDTDTTVLEALLSPTRTFAPIIAAVLSGFSSHISGLVHCTGGGQTKCIRFGKGIKFSKNLGSDMPAIFRAIKGASGMSWGEMAKIYNLGRRMEIYCGKDAADDILATIKPFRVEARVVGHTEASGTSQNKLELTLFDQVFEYSANL
jgi:phosphoribosylformylglycinamidine cyclo-ligase